MKKQTKSKNKTKVIKELASFFDQELTANLPVNVLPNGNIVYKTFLVKQMPNENWGVYNIHSKELVDQYYLKTCAIMAAKAYDATQIEKYFEIKRLDNRYWANYCDTVIYKRNIKTTKEFERYLILLNKLEHSNALTEHYREEISRMFKWSFV